MGNSESEADDRGSDAAGRHHAHFVKDFARQRQDDNEDYEEIREQMSKLLRFQRQRSDNVHGADNDGRVVEISGVEYHLTQFVNRGGFGQIFRAQDRKNNRLVAMKIIINTPSIQEEIKSEIEFLRVTKRIALENHPVIDYYGCKFTRETIFIAMELAATDLLTFWFSGAVPTSGEQRFMLAIVIIVYVLRALIFLEKLHIVHGDIKPQNLVIVPTQQHFFVKLIDFGTVEKMNTKCAQLTVGADKAHTVFYASPEFLRRDARNLISRHLHKKSDAWAAGVMFYVLFFGKYPWKDEFEYENFCNNPRARDIVVPREGGYKTIIEFLLKKNPEERTSAKSTYMQMKAHPRLRTMIKVFQDHFCSVDEVCRMTVPDEVRQALGRLPRSSETAQRTNSASFTTGTRRPCRFGQNCFNTDRDHRREFAHPGDSDRPEKLKCRYGVDCYRFDPEHRKKYLHPVSADNGESARIKCRYGSACRKDSLEHFQRYSHPNFPNRDKCRYGDACYKTDDPAHMQRFWH